MKSWREQAQFWHRVGQARLFPKRMWPFEGVWFLVWEYPLTKPGKLLIAGFGVSALFGAVTVEAPVYLVCLALVSLGLISSAVGSVFRLANVRITGSLPEKVSVGQLVEGNFSISNQGWLSVYDVAVACFQLPPGWEPILSDDVLPQLGIGEKGTLQVRLIPRKRGIFQLPPIRVFSTFPFNLNRNELVRCRGGKVVVVPAFHPLKTIQLEVGNRYQPGGIANTSNIGESPEYIGNREYMPGDATRRIDFRSWARLARPVVKEYQEEYFSRIALILDTFVPRVSKFEAIPGGYRSRPRPPHPGLEAAISLGAAIADALSRGEYVLDIFAAGPELHVFRTGRHITPLESVLEILAGVDACQANPFEKITPAIMGEFDRLSTVVCVFLDWDEPRREFVRLALESGCHVKAFVVRSGKGKTEPIQASIPVVEFTIEQITSGNVKVL